MPNPFNVLATEQMRNKYNAVDSSFMEITFLELKTVLTKWIGSLKDSRFTVYLYPAVIFVDRSLLARWGCV